MPMSLNTARQAEPQRFFNGIPRPRSPLPARAGAQPARTLRAPMPGKIIAVEVAAGQPVSKGQKLLTLEAMKMEHSLTAPFDGTIAELNAEPGGQVSEGTLLVRVESVETHET